jgi:putative oxidoreductase
MAGIMTTATTDDLDTRPTRHFVRSHDAERALPLLGRIFFSAIFILATPNHFSNRGADYAASQGVPFASIVVPIAGVVALLGALSVLLGYKAKAGAWLLIVFLIPVTLIMHRFWGLDDAQAAQMQMIHFMKNFSLIGGALFIAYFGAGPLSLDARIARTDVYARRD